MNWLHRLPLGRRLTVVILLVTSIALVIACFALALYQWATVRNAVARDARTITEVIGANSRAALAFDDEASAREVLAALSLQSEVLAAQVYKPNGNAFATFRRTGSTIPLPAHVDAERAGFEGDVHVVVRRIHHQDKPVGWIAVATRLQRLNEALAWFIATAVGVCLLACIIALPLAGWLQRPISGPILRLAEIARAIGERKDYSVRAPVTSSDELGLLTNAFNEMLGGLAEREAALRATNEKLARENSERLVAEERAHAQVLRLSQINQITRAMGERQDVQSIYQTVVGNLEQQLPVDFACVCLLDSVRQVLTVTALGPRGTALAPQMRMSETAEIRVDQNGLARCVAGELVYEPELASLPLTFPQRLVSGGLRALVIAPLIVEGKVMGVLLAARATDESFSSTDCEFIRQLSEHVALAAHQAQLYSALQRAYDDLRQTQALVMQQERLRALGQMASGIAHDINNAISPVSLYVETILEREKNLAPQSRDWLQTVQRSIDDVGHTVGRMREFYRQRGNHAPLVPVAVNRLVEQVLELTRARWSDMPQQRGVVIESRVELTEPLPLALGVESEIREALINLVFNAVDAVPRGGLLTLRTRVLERTIAGKSQPRVAVEVIDNGIGMSEETQRRCFEPFFTTKGERGSGLGLAMVYGIAKRHGAELEVESVVDRGTTVRLLFTLAPEGPAPLIDDLPLRPSAALRILIIDDDPLLVKSIRDILEGDGHALISASGGQAGINLFVDTIRQGPRFDVVITDLGMPYVDGRKVAAAVKSASPQTPVFLLTGWGNRLQVEGDIPPEVDLVLSKPPKLRELREALAGVPVLPR